MSMLKAKLKINIDTEKIKKIAFKTAWFLGRQAFWSFMIFIFAALFVGGAIFYYYGFLAATREPAISVKTIKLNDQFYQDFLDYYRQRKETFDAADTKIYLNPFSPQP